MSSSAQPSAAQSASSKQVPQEKWSLRRQVEAVLRAQDSRSMLGSLGALVGGAVWCAVAGLFFATMLTLAGYFLFEQPPLGFFAWLGVYVLLLVPVLVLLERAAVKQSIKVQSLSAATARAGDDAVEIHHAPSSFGPIVQFFTWGPRNLLDGLAGVRKKWKGHQDLVFRRASKLLLELAKYEGGVPIKSLVRPPEDMSVFDKAVQWLDRHDWLGKSSDGTKLWISTDGKKRLEQFDLMPGSSVKML